MRHNNVRDFETNLLKITLNDVEIEPKLQKIDNEELNGLTGDGARPVVCRDKDIMLFLISV